MTLKEAIEHCKDVSLSCTNKECALEHFQLLKWLQEYSNILKKQGEHTIDKVEPKFREGEWITNGDYTWKIVEVKPLDYILQSQDGNIVDDTISHVDEQFHSFTIEDAKDGDVLMWDNGRYIILFKEIKDNIVAHCSYNTHSKHFGFSSNYDTRFDCILNFRPATKEQCDALMKAMADAGYIFDFEKKELKKIEQKSSVTEWSEDDEQYLLVCKNALRKYEVTDKWDSNIISQWLDSKLKSIKPQKQWKPTEKQIRALYDLNITGNISYAGQGQVLIELYNDLNKL